jgi:hypothetical protein
MEERVWDPCFACCCGEDVDFWDFWIYLSPGPLRLCWMYL